MEIGKGSYDHSKADVLFSINGSSFRDGTRSLSSSFCSKQGLDTVVIALVFNHHKGTAGCGHRGWRRFSKNTTGLTF